MGNFDYNTQIDFDSVKLLSLGFTNQEVELLGSFLSMGYKVNSHLIKKIEDNSGNILYEYKEEKVNIFPDGKEKQEILGMFKAVGASLLSMANTAFKAQTGLDIQGAYERPQDRSKFRR